MRLPRALGLILVSVTVLAALAAGSAFAFSSSDDGVGRNAHVRPRPQEQEEPEDAQEQAEDDGNDGTAAASGRGGADKAALIAEEFGVSSDEVAALHADGIGWGALLKLYTYARVLGVSVDELAAGASTDAAGEREYAFGELKKSLTDDQLAALDDGPKNLGQLVSKAKKPAHVGPP